MQWPIPFPWLNCVNISSPYLAPETFDLNSSFFPLTPESKTMNIACYSTRQEQQVSNIHNVPSIHSSETPTKDYPPASDLHTVDFHWMQNLCYQLAQTIQTIGTFRRFVPAWNTSVIGWIMNIMQWAPTRFNPISVAKFHTSFGGVCTGETNAETLLSPAESNWFDVYIAKRSCGWKNAHLSLSKNLSSFPFCWRKAWLRSSIDMRSTSHNPSLQ